ncbi:MAG TPA: alanine--glyoxylate aminotransferase family protein [Ignavibacteria bacterium]|nr:alanine--glyoxylate aminotransferase family protein [Ignavibacteria bacterium]HMQ98002.1 alanine--glyoxylate aminotransferase family protein [Ignavibacteria bacterium]
MLNKKIFTPGPTQVHPDVLKATISFDTYHRSPEFKAFHGELIAKLKHIFQTAQNLNILTTSGTGSLETAVINFCNPKENVLFINQGRFGARWGAICKAYNINAVELPIEYGKSADVNDLEGVNLENISAVLLTHTETSTASLTDIKKLTEYIKSRSDALVIVDAVTSVGAIEFRFDKWNIDVAVSASQKGLMTQPGIAIIAYSEKARVKMENNDMPRFFFDLRKEYKSVKEDGVTMWTPAVGLFYGVDKACDIILEEGLPDRWKRTHEMAEYFRTESLKNGFGLFSSSPSDSLTAITLPGNIQTGKLIRAMKDNYGVQMANGQAEMKDKIARISHMGDLEMNDFVELNKMLVTEFKKLQS